MNLEDYRPPKLNRIPLEDFDLKSFFTEQKEDFMRKLDRAEREVSQFAQPPRFIGAFMLTMQDVCFLMQCGIAVD